MRIADMTWMQVETFLEGDDRCVLPLGSVEQHGYLSLATDQILAERVAVEAAEPSGVPVFPAVPYGLTPYFMGYPGTVTLTAETYGRVVTEILDSLASHGFRRILIVNGHGGNQPARRVAESWGEGFGKMALRWHDWFGAPETNGVARALDPEASHASWMESFAWTRIEGANPPQGHKHPVDLALRYELSPQELRARIGDGVMGGDYARSDDDLQKLWTTAVAETRREIEEGW